MGIEPQPCEGARLPAANRRHALYFEGPDQPFDRTDDGRQEQRWMNVVKVMVSEEGRLDGGS